MIRTARPSDAEAICRIYNEYVMNTAVTFEESPVPPADMAARIRLGLRTYPWLVYTQDGLVLGYCSAVRWKDRSAYRFAVEAAIYLGVGKVGKGLGSRLLARLLKELKTKSVHCVLAGIALPNPASVALFEKFGFKKVAHMKEIGYKMNRWIDVGTWQLLL
jgi:L-amino acid N-acyltransferase YncA